MKVLVPIDVQSPTDISAAVDAILDGVWPDDVEFYLLNVIEDEVPGGPCSQRNCFDHCRCVEPRVHRLSDVMRKLSSKMPNVPIYIEVMKGNLSDKLDAWRRREPTGQVVTAKPVCHWGRGLAAALASTARQSA
jgi:hypothetical protein